jgi:hypothetical protein
MSDRVYARFTEFFAAGAGIAGVLVGIGSIVVTIWLTKWTIRSGENNPPRHDRQRGPPADQFGRNAK